MNLAFISQQGHNYHVGLKEVIVVTQRRFFGVAIFLILFIPVMLHSIFGVALSPVLSGSMRPVFNPGDVLITQEVSAAKLHVGDIVVLRNGVDYSLFSHRIISIQRTGSKLLIATRGDANPTVDFGKVEISAFQPVPKGIGHIPWLGRVIVYFTNHKFSFLADVFILLLASYGMTRILTFSRKSKVQASRNVIQPQTESEKVSN